MSFIRINSENARNLIGFKVQVFLPELGRHVEVYMSIAQTLEYVGKCWADVEAVWLSEAGELVESFAKVFKHRTTGAPGIAIGCYNDTPAVWALGYRGQDEKPELNGEWYQTIGQTAYPILDIEGHIDSIAPGSIGYFEGRKAQLLNLAGFDKITRCGRELAGAALSARYPSLTTP